VCVLFGEIKYGYFYLMTALIEMNFMMLVAVGAVGVNFTFTIAKKDP